MELDYQIGEDIKERVSIKLVKMDVIEDADDCDRFRLSLVLSITLLAKPSNTMRKLVTMNLTMMTMMTTTKCSMTRYVFT